MKKQVRLLLVLKEWVRKRTHLLVVRNTKTLFTQQSVRRNFQCFENSNFPFSDCVFILNKRRIAKVRVQAKDWIRKILILIVAVRVRKVRLKKF